MTEVETKNLKTTCPGCFEERICLGLDPNAVCFSCNMQSLEERRKRVGPKTPLSAPYHCIDAPRKKIELKIRTSVEIKVETPISEQSARKKIPLKNDTCPYCLKDRRAAGFPMCYPCYVRDMGKLPTNTCLL
jgi:hypothetical protein